MKRALALTAALFLLAAPVVAWQPTAELLTAQQRLEKLDRDLLPIQGALTAALEDYLAAPASLDDAFLLIIQTRAIQAWERVRAEPWDACTQQYQASLLVGYAAIADSIDSWNAGDREAASIESSVGWYLVQGHATLERNATTCEGIAVPTPLPTPTATPGHTPLPTPTATPEPSR